MLVASLLLAACGGDDDAPPAVAPAPTTTSAPTPATAPPPRPVSPLTGLVVADPATRTRPALVVKIDNHPKAWPQIGLDVADVVYEEVVEGSATRFAAVFQSTDSDPVGPVRSARTTDVALVSNLNTPLFAWAGANAGVEREVRAAAIVDVSWNARPAEYARRSGRAAPSNLFTETSALRSTAEGEGGAAPALFTYRPAGAPPAGGEVVPAVTVAYGGQVGVTVVWRWDAAAGGWTRTQGGRAHTVEGGGTITPENVVVQFVDYHDSGFVDVTGARSPEAELVGSGEAWVLTAGQLVRGTWSRPSAADATTYADAAGQPIGLTPGRTWVALPPPGSAEVTA